MKKISATRRDFLAVLFILHSYALKIISVCIASRLGQKRIAALIRQCYFLKRRSKKGKWNYEKLPVVAFSERNNSRKEELHLKSLLKEGNIRYSSQCTTLMSGVMPCHVECHAQDINRTVLVAMHKSLNRIQR